MWNRRDLDALVTALGKLPPIPGQSDSAFEPPALRLLDCVLSLNRRYYEFVRPRVERFRERHPDVTSLANLRQCVASCGSPATFYQRELDYGWPEAAETFYAVLNHLLEASQNSVGSTDVDRLHSWAVSAEVDGFKAANIALFGVAGWQYLRMLFGADTCKPDIAVKRFVKASIGRNLGGISAVGLVENAAPLVPELHAFEQPVREADRRIWHQYNGQSKRNQPRTGGHGR